MAAAEGGEQRHFAAGVADVPVGDVLGLHPIGGVGLHIDLFDPPLMDEIVDVVRAPSGGQGGVDVADRDPQGHGFLKIDVHVVLIDGNVPLER